MSDTIYKKLPLDDQGNLIERKFEIMSPSNLINISFPKSGKTDNMCNVKNFLIGDCEKGTEFFKASNAVNLLSFEGDQAFARLKSGAFIPMGIYQTCMELYKANNMKLYWELKSKLSDPRQDQEKAYNEIRELLAKMPFPIFVIDTITSIQDLNYKAALEEYNSHIVNVDKKKTDIRRVDEYGGVQYIRRSFDSLKKFIEMYAAPFIIWNGHIKEKKKILRKDEDEIAAIDIALDGIISTTFTAKADAVCVFHRNDEGCFMDFRKKDESDLDARPRHLGNKSIKVADLHKYDEEGNLESKGATHWEKIYPELQF